MEQIVKGNNTFALDVYGKLKDNENNLFLSPYSISSALAMTYAGARGNTATQMAEVLHFLLSQKALHPAFANLSAHFQEIQQTGNVTLTIANALWIQEGLELLEDYLNLVKKYYDAGLFQVNFVEASEEVRQEINSWVEEQTHQKIRNILAPGTLNELTRLVLTNAIYFKGNWEMEFNKDQTQQESFWPTPGQEIQTPMMHQQSNFKYGETETVQILQMPYAGKELSLVALLPKTKDGLAELETQLTAERLGDWLPATFLRKVNVSFPKFKLTSQFSLSAALRNLGMTEAFSDKADFSGMESTSSLSISDVIHKAFVDVNEEGTEAAAATGVSIGVTSIREPEPIPEFKADHPFMFLIQEKQTGSILFLGRVMNPAE